VCKERISAARRKGGLVAAAKAADALIVLRFRPGQFVLRGEPLAAIIASENVSKVEIAIDRGILIGRHRTLTQDSEFGIAQVVEIAIRALSPAVNDTFTGVRALTGSPTRCSRWPNAPLLEGTGTTKAVGYGYGCQPCGSSAFAS
jgi:hypothetical protein